MILLRQNKATTLLKGVSNAKLNLCDTIVAIFIILFFGFKTIHILEKVGLEKSKQ